MLKHKRKNRGNIKLLLTIDKLILDLENATWKNKFDIQLTRKDADQVSKKGFYFFDLSNHRTMILISFIEDEASVVWIGSHDHYQKIFKDNKKTIEKWLRNQDLI